MSRTTRVALVATVGAVIAAFVWVAILPDEAPATLSDTSPGLARLDTVFQSRPPNACSGCHASWESIALVNATREKPREGGAATYAMSIMPVSAYEFAVAAAAPRRAGDGVPDPFATEATLSLTAGRADHAVKIPFDAGAIMVEVFSRASYARPPLEFTASAGRVEGAGEGSAPNKRVLLVAEAGRALARDVKVSITARETLDADTLVHVIVRAFPPEYRVARNVSGERPAAYEWRLDTDAPNGPTRIHVALLPFNAHPTDRWMITTNGDHSYYEGNVTLNTTVPWPTPPTFATKELDAIWGGATRKVIAHETFTGTVSYERNSRGEWTRERRALTEPLTSRPPRPAGTFPAIPPDTAHLESRITWESLNPLDAAAPWYLAVSLPPKPDFTYPSYQSLRANERIDIVPVGPNTWETDPSSHFMAYARLALDADGRARFTGTYTLTVEAVRG